jgi:hypothetical protein
MLTAPSMMRMNSVLTLSGMDTKSQSMADRITMLREARGLSVIQLGDLCGWLKP